MPVDQFANKLLIDKGVVFHDIQKIAETTLRIFGEGKNGRELIKEGFEVFLWLMRRVSNARTDKHFGAEPVGCIQPLYGHLVVKSEGTLDTPVFKKRVNAPFEQGKAKAATFSLRRDHRDATLEFFYSILGSPSLQ